MMDYFLFLIFYATASKVLYSDASQIKFQAYPPVLKSNFTSAASMRCDLVDTNVRKFVQNTTDDVTHVTSIVITYKDGQIVAQGSPFEAPIALVDPGNLQVKGDVSGATGEGYLELSWKDPSLMSVGEYVCEINTIDASHTNTAFKSSLTIAREEPSTSDILTRQQMMETKQQMMQQEITNLQESNAHLQKNMTILALNNVQLQNEIMLLNAKSSNCSEQVGFSAYFVVLEGYGRTSKFSYGQTVVYMYTELNQGGGYNESTGVFTCRLAGMYVFNVHAQTHGSHEANLKLRHNRVRPQGAELSAVATSDSDYQSASMTSVLHLQRGDTVWVEANLLSYLLVNNKNSFHGFLVQPDNC